MTFSSHLTEAAADAQIAMPGKTKLAVGACSKR